MKSICLLFLLAAGAEAAQAQAYNAGFVIKIGGDTIAFERFNRTSEQLRGELFDRTSQTRRSYRLTLRNGIEPVLFSTSVARLTSPEDAPPAAQASVEFRGDSAYTQVVLPTPGSRTLATRTGAIPFVNLSLALTEFLMANARRAGTDSVTANVFLLAGGQTLPVTMQRVGRDSIALGVAGSEMRLRVDPTGRILGAVVPSQNLTVVRLDSASTDRIRWTRPDYSAPADAAYTAEDLAIPAPPGHSLGATLTKPKTAAGRLPVAITISGSGLQDRDESLAGVTGYRPFRQIAEALAAKGIATLRFDDRGTGASTGNGATATSADFADDVRAIIQYLRARPDIDPNRIVLVGHSEGGLIAPMVAAGDTLLRGIALLAGPAQSGRTIIHYQQRFAAENDTTIRPADREALLQRARIQLDSIARTNPWMRFFLDHDPLAVAARVRVPVLILQGETDRQVTADQAPTLASAFRNARNQNVVVHVLPRVNHLFLEDPSGSPSGYAGLPSKRIPDSILSLLTDWVVQRVR